MPDISHILSAVEQSNLVSDDVIGELRQRLEKSRQPPDLKAAVKWLVQKEHITSDQGRRLLSRAGTPSAGTAPKPVAGGDDDDDLKLVDEPPAAPAPSKAPPARQSDDDLGFSPLEDAQVSEASADSSPSKKSSDARWAGTPQAPSPRRSERRSEPTAAKTKSARRQQATSSREPAYDAGQGDDVFATADDFGGDDRGRPERGKKKAAGGQRSIWDTPLMLLGGGGLALIIIAIAFFVFRIGRLSGDESFRQADELYKSGSHTQAIDKFDKYLEEFPDHEQVSLARVERGMARMRQAVEGGRDFSKTLATVKSILAEISPEEQFGEAQKELASLLPQTAAGLARQADTKADGKVVEEGEEALKLVDKYVRKTIRPEQQLADVRASLELTKRKLGRDAALKEAVTGIQKSIADGAPQQAYQIRKQLLKQYPALAGNEELLAAVLSLSKAEKEAVSYKAEARSAAPADAQSPVEAEVVMGVRQGKNAPGVTGEVVPVLAGGAAFAFNAETGEILWRRFLGYDTTFVPRAISVDADSDLLMVDSQRHEVLRVARSTGALKWRYIVGEPFDAHPVFARGQVWVATRPGKLVTIELETGNSPGYIELPQGLRVGPSFDSREQVAYQLGENSNLFSLSPQSFQCQEVLYLGHEPESVHVSPLVISPYVFIVEDQGAGDSLLHVLAADDRGTNLRSAQEPMVLAGHVRSPLEASGRTLVVVTDRGAVYSFEINPPDPGPPLTKVAERPPENGSPLIRYPRLKDSQLWMAGLGLSKYDVQSARGKLDPRWVIDEGDTFLEQPVLIGNVLIGARRQGNQPDVLVGAISAQDHTRYWETRVAAPPAGPPVTDAKSGRMLLFNRVGALFDFSPDNLRASGTQNAAGLPEDLNEPFSGAVAATPLATGGAAISSAGAGWRALVAPESNRLQWLALPDSLGAPAASFRGGLLVPGRMGQVFVIDPASGRSVIQPFQPRLERGLEFNWSNPLVLNEDEVLLADGTSKFYRLSVIDKPEPHLVALAETTLAGPVTAPLAVAGQTAYAVNGRGELTAFLLGRGAAKTLEPGNSWPLDGGAAWGPFAAGSNVLVATNVGQLLCLNDSQELVWQVELKHGPLSGTPLVSGDGVLVSTKSGQLLRLALASGDELGLIDVGEPVAAGPIAVGERLLLASKGGSLLVVAKP
ncbi:MAG TPA: PQQ-binding-like beta-propeller repeat protein [Pirellulales bacterium]|nr:PQQ-binding-like beta-propeller repeat protein [Pirellulales bacterium]